MQVKLRVMRGSSSGKEIGLKGPKFVIGRAEDCHMRARSDAISRRHCAVLIRSSHVSVRDLGSRNGTYVNGVRIESEHALQDGDHLQVGPLEFTVVVQQSATAKTRYTAAHQSDSGVGDLVSEWLDEMDQQEADVGPDAPSDTRRFRAEDTNRVALEELGEEGQPPSAEEDTKVVKPGASAEQSAEADESAEVTDQGQASGTQDAKRGKTPKGKLPTRPAAVESPGNTQEAAAEMLRKLFRRR